MQAALMCRMGSLKSDVVRLGILMGLCFLIGVYLISRMPLISPDGVFYIEQARQLARDPAGVARKHSPGYPLLIWVAHKAATVVAQEDSVMLWVHSAQGVTLLCRVLALIPLYLLGKRLIGGANSFWTLLVLILLPYPARYGSDVLREWPYLLFLSLGFWLLLRAAVSSLLRSSFLPFPSFFLVGLVAGLGYLIRPECAQLIVYALLGLALVFFVGTGVHKVQASISGLLLIAGLVGPLAPYVYVTGTIVPHQLRPSISNAPPVISAIGAKAAEDEPLEFEVSEGGLLELPIEAVDPDGKPLAFSMAGAPTGSRPVYDFLSPSTGGRFWTILDEERDLLLTRYSTEVWRYEGIAYYAYPQADARPGLRPIYRFWSPARRRHLYTMDEAERDAILREPLTDPWQYEGAVFYAFGQDNHPLDTVPVYRLWSDEDGYSWTLGDEARGARARGAGLDPRPSGSAPTVDTIAWYAHAASEPPTGAVIEDRVFRWRPRPGQTGDYQINVIVSDGELQSCQLVRIRVHPQSATLSPRTPIRDRNPQSMYAGFGKLPKAVNDLIGGIAEDLMVILFVPWLLGLYYRLRYEAGRLERVLIVALVAVNVGLILGRHVGLAAGEDRRYGLPLIALTIFYIPTGVETIARALGLGDEGRSGSWGRHGRGGHSGRRRTGFAPTSSTMSTSSACRSTGPAPRVRGLGSRVLWFYLLVVGIVALCLPKLLSARTDKIGYRAASEWLRQNTQAQDIIAVPDIRISFYAEREGAFYLRYPDSRRADYVAAISDGHEPRALEGWQREYSVRIDPSKSATLIIYRTSRPKK